MACIIFTRAPNVNELKHLFSLRLSVLVLFDETSYFYLWPNQTVGITQSNGIQLFYYYFVAADHAQLSQASAAATFVSCEPAALERHLQTKRKVGTTPESTHILRRTSVVVRQLAITNVVRPALTLKRELLARPLLCTLVLLLSDISCDKRLER